MIRIPLKSLKKIQVLFAISICTGCGPRVEHMELSEADARAFAAAAIASVSAVDQNQVEVVIKARLRCDKSGSGSACIVGVGDTLSIPDHHVSTVIEVRTIKPGAVNFSFFSRFDHRSFGRDLISETRGEFSVPFAERR